jgi:hypothetical protein
MIHFEKGEPVNISNCIIYQGGNYDDLELVPICKWDSQDEIYTMVQAYFIKFGVWK